MKRISRLLNKIIRSQFIGRDLLEDRSLNRKEVFALPPGSEGSVWKYEPTGERTGLLYNRGAEIAAVDKKLWGILMPGEVQAENWVITVQPQYGDNVYTIQKNDESAGWVVRDGGANRTQVNVDTLIIGESLPPHYPDTELFIITPHQ